VGGERVRDDARVADLSCTSLTNNENNLLRFNGQVRWWDGTSSSRSQQAAHTLMDNAASECFVSRRLADKLKADGCENKVKGWMRVKVATEAEPVKQRRETVKVPLWLRGYKYEKHMTVLDMDEYDIILGKPWYTDMNLRHTIDYERNVMWIHPPRAVDPKESRSDTEQQVESQWEGMLVGLRPWEGRGRKSEVQRDMDCVNSILNNVELVWGNSSTLEKQAKKRGFLVRLRLMDEKAPPDVANQTKDAIERLESDFADVFTAPTGVPIRWKDGKAVEMTIELTDPDRTPFKTPYRLSRAETEELVKVLTVALEKGWIRPSTSSFGAPVLFVPKKGPDGVLNRLRMVIDYRELNAITKKDRYPLPLIEDQLDGLEGARIFSKMDLASGYNQLGIAEADRHKTAFVTKFGLFEWTVVPFGLANAPAFFMRWMDKILQANPHLRSFVKLYLDDILIHSRTLEEQDGHLREVFRILRESGMKVERKKCEFFVSSLDFLGFRVDAEGIHVEAGKAAAVAEWGTPTTPRAVKSFLGLVGYYRKFVPGFAEVAQPLYKASSTTGREFAWDAACQKALDQLKYLVTHAPVLAVPTRDGEYIVRTDASQNAVGAVLMQKQIQPDGTIQERTIAFYSRQLSPSQRNYGAYDRELLAIEEAVLHWRYYLQQSRFTVYTDHRSIQHLLSQRLTHRQMSYFATLLGYDFTIKYWPGSKNDIADALSRRYEEVLNNVQVETVANTREGWWRQKQERRIAYALGCDSAQPGPEIPTTPGTETTCYPEAMATQVTIDRVSEAVDQVQDEYAQDKWLGPVWRVLRAQEELRTREDSGDFDNWSPTDLKKWRQEQIKSIKEAVSKTEWERSRRFQLVNGILQHKDLVCIPEGTLRNELLAETHDALSGGHVGAAKMHVRLQDMGLYWRGMEKNCQRYVKGCGTCLRVKPGNQRPAGLLQQLGVPEGRWERIGIDFVTGLPPSGDEGYDSIMSIIDHMTKRAHFIPYHKETGAEETAEIFIDRYYRLHGVPQHIVSDRDPRFIADFWKAFTAGIGASLRMSSTAHPETDGQTEKANDIVGIYLRCFATRFLEKGWHKLLPLAEFAYNSTPQKALRKSPFEVDLGYHPPSKIQLIGAALGAPDRNITAKAKQGDEFAQHLQALLLAAKDDLEAAQDSQRADANSHRREHDFQEGDMVLLDAPKDHISYSNLVPGSTKLQHRYGGPHRIIWVRGTAVKLDLGKDLPINDVFHVSRLRHDTTDKSRPQEPIPPLRLAKKGESFEGVSEILRILDHSPSGTNKKNLQYLIEWNDYSGDTQWLQLDDLRNARELVEEYHVAHDLGAVDWEAKRRAAAAKARKKRKEYWG
jgi:hypothetical protein